MDQAQTDVSKVTDAMRAEVDSDGAGASGCESGVRKPLR